MDAQIEIGINEDSGKGQVAEARRRGRPGGFLCPKCGRTGCLAIRYIYKTHRGRRYPRNRSGYGPYLVVHHHVYDPGKTGGRKTRMETCSLGRFSRELVERLLAEAERPEDRERLQQIYDRYFGGPEGNRVELSRDKLYFSTK